MPLVTIEIEEGEAVALHAVLPQLQTSVAGQGASGTPFHKAGVELVRRGLGGIWEQLEAKLSKADK
jgi:hypothetical protein